MSRTIPVIGIHRVTGTYSGTTTIFVKCFCIKIRIFVQKNAKFSGGFAPGPQKFPRGFAARLDIENQSQRSKSLYSEIYSIGLESRC